MASLAASTAQATLVTSHLGTDAAMFALSPTFSFVAEGRIGDRAGAATFELDLGQDTGAPFTTAQYGWVSGQVEAFSLTYDASTHGVTFILGGRTLNYTASGALSDIFIRTRESFAGSSLSVDNLVLNSVAVGDQAGSVGPGLDILRISGAPLAAGFTLSGNATLSWAGSAPTQSNLAFQIKVGSLPTTPSDATTWGRIRRLYYR